MKYTKPLAVFIVIFGLTFLAWPSKTPIGTGYCSGNICADGVQYISNYWGGYRLVLGKADQGSIFASSWAALTALTLALMMICIATILSKRRP
jgi:hypothetical protein